MIEGILATSLGAFFGSGLVPTITKIGLQFSSPLLFVFLRFLFATIFFFPSLLFFKRMKLKKKDYVKLFLLAFFLFVNVSFFSIGVKYTTVLMSQMLYLPTPIVVSLFGHFFLDEKLTKNKMVGLCIALFGVLYLLSQSLTTVTAITFGTPVGNMLVLFAMLGYSAWVLYTRSLSKSNRYSPYQLTFYTFLFLSLYVLLSLPIEHFFLPTRVPFHFPQGLFLSFLIALVSIVQYFFLQLGIKKTSAFTASIFQYTGPVFAGIVSIPLLHEKLSVSFIIGGVIIIVGVFYATTFPYIKRSIGK